MKSLKNESCDCPGGPGAKTLCSHCGGPGSIPGQGTGVRAPQLKVPCATVKINPHAASRTWGCQISKFKNVLKRKMKAIIQHGS